MNTLGFIGAFIGPVIAEMQQAYDKNEERINQIRKEYFEDSTLLPRKKKKAMRKRLQSEYNVCIWMRSHYKDMLLI